MIQSKLLLEAIAVEAGFNAEGGSRGNQFSTVATEAPSSEYLRLSWLPNATDGFFFRARVSSISPATWTTPSRKPGSIRMQRTPVDRCTNNPTVNRSSTCFTDGCPIADPHSPILLGYPGATLLSFDGERIEPIDYHDTSHYIISKQFLHAPEKMLHELFRDD
ncbi:hypothetical protein [Alicyclobacillus acidiphilus]|uniref:hypothetical protein n=1 Tax=Alicyclobacillus acidiphilus TaxID=182455 RepID=UPI00082CD17B|nr:hypothetical protein [Alicyclobacillus acidiphilus]